MKTSAIKNMYHYIAKHLNALIAELQLGVSKSPVVPAWCSSLFLFDTRKNHL